MAEGDAWIKGQCADTTNLIEPFSCKVLSEQRRSLLLKLLTKFHVRLERQVHDWLAIAGAVGSRLHRLRPGPLVTHAWNRTACASPNPTGKRLPRWQQRNRSPTAATMTSISSISAMSGSSLRPRDSAGRLCARWPLKGVDTLAWRRWFTSRGDAGKALLRRYLAARDRELS